MRNLLLFTTIFVLLAVSCSAPSGEKEVAASYERFAAAVRAEDSAVVDSLAPHLKDDPSGEALRILKAILDADPSYRVRLLEPSKAAVRLTDSRRTIIPFEKNERGEWLVADQVQRRDIIDFVPAEGE
jgi:hypothetical protein